VTGDDDRALGEEEEEEKQGAGSLVHMDSAEREVHSDFCVLPPAAPLQAMLPSKMPRQSHILLPVLPHEPACPGKC